MLQRLALPRLLGLLLVLGGAIAAALPATSPTAPALAAPAPPTGPEPQLVPVRFGSPQSISDAGVIIGRARGYFRELGLDVDSLNFQSGPDLIAPMASGELQAGGGNFSLAFLNAVDRGINLKMVADKGTGKAGFEFVQFPVRRALLDSGEVRTVADLRGRRVAVASLRAGAEAIANQVLGTGGLGVDDVELTVLSYPDMLVAFGNNAIDAGVVIEPSLSAGYTRGLMAPWTGGSVATAFGGTYQAGLLYFSGQFAAQTDQAQRFMVGYLRGVREYNDAFVKGQGRDDVVRMLMDGTSMKDPAQYDAMSMAGLDPDGRVFRPSLQIELDFFRGRGYYSGNSTVDQIVDTSFAEYAVAQLGPYR
jgi:NitT/TauT family transport system substrate-binding protein